MGKAGANIEIKEIVFRSDTAERKKWFKGLHFLHPAKMSLGLQIYLIEHYSKPGDVILDPMFGSGTLLVACAIGRHVIGVELEQKFVDMAKQSWEKVKSLGPILGYQMGTATIIQGDARQLPEVLADVCCFSPPYADQDSFSKRQGKSFQYTGKHRTSEGHCELKQKITGESEDQIGNLKYGEIDKIICSPPYEAQGFKCDENPANVLKREAKRREKYPMRPKIVPGRYGNTTENIGNLKADNYLSAMKQVYEGCYRVLKDGGLMVLVTKNFIRNKKIVRLDLDTIKLCEACGFTLIELLKRKLTSQSFWRTIYYSKYPDAPRIDYEDVLVFKKG